MDAAKGSPIRRFRHACATFLLMACCTLVAAQSSPLPQEAPGDLVRAAVANELAANNNSAKHMFLSRKKTPKGTQTHLYVETDDAMAGILVALNDQPLTAQQEQTEEGHLAWLTHNPDQLRHKQAREKEDAERSLRIVKALPEAFRYEYDGTATGEAGMGTPGVELVRLKFTPNPRYVPPTRVEEVLAGMEGTVLIDAHSKRLAKIDGTLFRDITFGWGLVGRLDKGGRFMVKQADVGEGCWEITEMHLDIKGRILLVKSLTYVSDEVFSDFRRMPDHLTFAQGVKDLEAAQQKMEGNFNTQARNPQQ